MIGDNLVLDVAGGQAAGLHTIWIQPAPHSSAEPTAGSVAGAVEMILGAPG